MECLSLQVKCLVVTINGDIGACLDAKRFRVGGDIVCANSDNPLRISV